MDAAFFSWCASVQLPLLVDVERATARNELSDYRFAPLIGLLLVGIFIRDRRAVIGFTGIALALNLTAGVICCDIRQVVSLCTFTLLTGVGFWRFCKTANASAMLQTVHDGLDKYQRGLDNLQEQLDGK